MRSNRSTMTNEDDYDPSNLFDDWAESSDLFLGDIFLQENSLSVSPTIPQNIFNMPPAHNEAPVQNNVPPHPQHGLVTPLPPDLVRPTGTSHFFNNGQTTEIKTEVSSPLVQQEDSVDFSSIQVPNTVSRGPNRHWVMASPLLILSLKPWTGIFNFRVSIPPPSLEGIKPKWCFSYLLEKLYVAKQIAFPVSLTLDQYPAGATLVLCPIFNKSENRMTPVIRCPNCQISDPNPALRDHVIQVEGSRGTYFSEDDRCMVSVPLGSPAPGDACVNLFLKVACNTSCVGGPNRRPFSILISLRLENREIGRQVINVKCCEGPERDRGKDESSLAENNTHYNENNTLETVLRVAKDLDNYSHNRKSSSKRKKETKISQVPSDVTQLETITIPKEFVKNVKEYVNFLHMKKQAKGKKKLKLYFPSESDSD